MILELKIYFLTILLKKRVYSLLNKTKREKKKLSKSESESERKKKKKWIKHEKKKTEKFLETKKGQRLSQ